MNKAKQFGETVEGYNIPVLNEREIRASAGMLFISMFFAWMLVIFKESYFLIKFVNTIFLTDFIIRVMISPRYSPSLIIGRLIVGGQTPEYVGAAQKKFAWTIGLVLATKEKTQYCPGEVCDVKAKQEIQKTSLLQKGVVIVSFAYMIAAAILFNNIFSAKPTDLWVIVKSVLSL